MSRPGLSTQIPGKIEWKGDTARRNRLLKFWDWICGDYIATALEIHSWKNNFLVNF